ncbi:hypothetical protein J1605_001698 [Eschrichtius robustus]|uniref:Uncharacterized protein n=1 Tax=Eschrichtius robustus TaxID=9764 RepID=A0AB34I3X3_ESCRO|nr:hypothetical protein J1605_001698 [Eschrichtius robustus]
MCELPHNKVYPRFLESRSCGEMFLQTFPGGSFMSPSTPYLWSVVRGEESERLAPGSSVLEAGLSSSILKRGGGDMRASQGIYASSSPSSYVNLALPQPRNCALPEDSILANAHHGACWATILAAAISKLSDYACFYFLCFLQ